MKILKGARSDREKKRDMFIYLYNLINLKDEWSLAKIDADDLASFFDTHNWV